MSRQNRRAIRRDFTKYGVFVCHVVWNVVESRRPGATFAKNMYVFLQIETGNQDVAVRGNMRENAERHTRRQDEAVRKIGPG